MKSEADDELELDPTCSSFNPLAALYSDKKKVKIQGVDGKAYDNVAVFEATLRRNNSGANETTNEVGLCSWLYGSKSCHRTMGLLHTFSPRLSLQSKKRCKMLKLKGKEKSFSKRKKLAAEAAGRDLSKLKQMMEDRKKLDRAKKDGGDDDDDEKPEKKPTKLKPRNIFTTMEKLSTGPMSLLTRAVEHKTKCRVYTRHFCGLRGVLVGVVAAFDRFMNLAMTDVDETFSMSPRGEVVNHQKSLTVAQLDKAIVEMNRCSIGKQHGKSEAPPRQSDLMRHRATAGVVRRPAPCQSSTTSHHSATGDAGAAVKRLPAWQGLPPIAPFHGSSPQLYHRHMACMYVRGDSVVLVTLNS